MDSIRITVKPTPGITPEQARASRARALRFALDCYAKKNAARCDQHLDGDEDTKEAKNIGTVSKKYSLYTTAAAGELPNEARERSGGALDHPAGSSAPC